MHNIEKFTYPENVDKRKVEAELNDYVAHEDWQEGASGLPNPIRWVQTPVFDSYEEAERYIEQADKGRWYNCMAVRYKEPMMIRKLSRKEMELQQKIKEQAERLQKAISEGDPRKRKSEYIGCQKCGSSLKRELLKQHFCPLCGENLRSDTAQKRILNADKRLRELQNALKSEAKAQDQKLKPSVMWLVKIEYHT